ncbi:MAG: RluA family pseudouridine synthase [bacterium]
MRFLVDKGRLRADIFLARCLTISRSLAQSYFKKGCVLFQGTKINASFYLKKGDFLEFLEPDLLVKKDDDVRDDVPALSLLYEDEALLIVNKPAGLLVHAARDRSRPTLVDLLLAYGCSLSKGISSERPGIVHRLDADTEGLMVVTKTDSVQTHLADQFKSRTVLKSYYAMVYGNVLQDHRVLNYAIARHPKHGHLRCVSRHGRPAETTVSVLSRFNTKTLLDLQPKTGRTHQLRVHLSAIGHAIIGDPFYSKYSGSGQLLQAYSLSFIHPIFKKRYCFVLPLSDRLVGTC